MLENHFFMINFDIFVLLNIFVETYTPFSGSFDQYKTTFISLEIFFVALSMYFQSLLINLMCSC